MTNRASTTPSDIHENNSQRARENEETESRLKNEQINEILEEENKLEAEKKNPLKIGKMKQKRRKLK